MINPYNTPQQEWFDKTSGILGSLVTPPVLADPDLWKDWARVVVQFPPIAECVPPNPDQYEKWWEWATRFNEAVSQLFN